MTPEQISAYSSWNSRVVEVAIRDYFYALGVIEPLVGAHVFHEYYAQGMTPEDAMGQYELDN